MVLASFEALGTHPHQNFASSPPPPPDNFVHAGVKPLAVLPIALHPYKQL